MGRSETETFIAALDEPTASTLTELCELIRSAVPEARESIKWNAPSFSLSDHFATTGVNRDGSVRLVLHAGAKKSDLDARSQIADPAHLLEWKGADRAVVNFDSVEGLRANAGQLAEIVTAWAAQLH